MLMFKTQAFLKTVITFMNYQQLQFKSRPDKGKPEVACQREGGGGSDRGRNVPEDNHG